MKRFPINNMNAFPSFDLNEIIEGEFIEAYFQPIVSVKNNSIVGYEGLARGIHPRTNGLISPMDLFAEAAEKNLTLPLDRLCRKMVLEYFQGIHAKHPERLLSLNFEASVLDQGAGGSGKLIEQVQTLGLSPQSVVIEIIESNVENVDELQRFIKTHRELGFLIALDDVGAGHSNLNRIPLLKPDILKVDRYLVQDIADNFYKQEVFKSMIGLARKIGALIVAEGIETDKEAMAALEMGVDMVQGYYFAQPQRHDLIDDVSVGKHLLQLTRGYKEKVIQKLNVRRFNLRKYEMMTREIQADLSKTTGSHFEAKIKDLVRFFPLAEGIYVLDEQGFQVTETVFGDPHLSQKNRAIFNPVMKGTDHTLRDYFYMLTEGGLRKNSYITDPYISMASGSLCVTFSRLFKDAEKKDYVLCVDINTEYLQQIPGAFLEE
jgi:EAL domain-containing protein (putative c-di-GMP-specific phosphodiesterase class I)